MINFIIFCAFLPVKKKVYFNLLFHCYSLYSFKIHAISHFKSSCQTGNLIQSTVKGIILRCSCPLTVLASELYRCHSVSFFKQTVKMLYRFIPHSRSDRLYGLVGFLKQYLCFLHPGLLNDLLKRISCMFFDIFRKIGPGKMEIGGKFL